MSTAGELKRQIKKKTKCYFLREGSNHEIWVNPDTGGGVSDSKISG